MRARASEERIRELARELAPVRPIPPLGAVLAAMLALWLGGIAAEWLLGGRGLAARGGDWSAPGYLVALVGLALSALGASTAALATAVPGREGAARLAALAAGSGMALAIAGGLWGVAGPAPGELGPCLSCMTRALKLGVPPALLACGFLVYCAWRRPAAGTALALGGAAALGAAAVHASCPSLSPLHQLVAHTLVPVIVVAALTLPLALLVRQRGR